MANGEVGLVTRLSKNPILAVLVVILFLAVFGFAANSYMVMQYSKQDKTLLRYANQLIIMSQEVAKSSSKVLVGGEEVYANMSGSAKKLERYLEYLKVGDPTASLPRPPLTAIADLNNMTMSWEKMRTEVDFLMLLQGTVGALREANSDLTISLSAIQQENSKVVAALLRSNAAPNQVALAQRQSLLIERLMHSVNKILEIGNAKLLVDNINRDKQTFRKVLNGLRSGDRDLLLTTVTDNEAKKSLSVIEELFRTASERLTALVTNSMEGIRVSQAMDNIFNLSNSLKNDTESLIANSRIEADSRIFTPTTGLMLGLLVLVCAIAILIIQYRDAQSTMAETAAQNEKNQEAILTLLDELADFSDGDLTVQATVTGSFTGAIADSINFSIDQTRDIISQINETSTRVSQVASETQKSVTELETASQKQSQEISDVSSAVDDMAISIDKVSYNAAESTSVAERSVEIANNGALVVKNTIGGMEKIRGQIQETAKRIKRLGESSQEIGDIVNLINDIADQTNILSLNAAIQASMAGEAGRGFAVVADEVQRLAERSGAAAKQIAALVKTIQSDTNEAVISMEQTTSEVVQGARLAQDAGVALDEIEGVSKSLAEIIENISDASRQQAASAGKISNTMKSIQEITSQTTDRTRSIVGAVGNFAGMTDELRASVSGFKLPK
jgi:twitching motility protein PilJ